MKIFLLVVVLLALGALALPRLYRKILRPLYLRRRYRRILENRTSYRIGEFLGMGRDGIVFALESDQDHPEPRAIKVHYASAKGSTIRRSELYDQIVEVGARASGGIGALAETGLLRIYERGDCGAGGRRTAFEVIERVKGKTLKVLRREDYFRDAGPEASLALIQQLLERLERLESLGIFFVHVDLDNLILDPAGNLRIIDIESLTLGNLPNPDPKFSNLGKLNKKYRKRYHRRICQTISEILNQAGIRPDAFGEDPAARSFFAKLDANIRASKKESLSSVSSFDSLDEIREGFATLSRTAAKHSA